MEWLTPFTDWSQTDPRYFYVRGGIAGGLVTLLVICASHACAAIRCKRRILKARKQNEKSFGPDMQTPDGAIYQLGKDGYTKTDKIEYRLPDGTVYNFMRGQKADQDNGPTATL